MIEMIVGFEILLKNNSKSVFFKSIIVAALHLIKKSFKFSHPILVLEWCMYHTKNDVA